MVELALALPMMMLLIFGAVEFGTAMYDKAVITNASREGARFGIVATTPRKTNREIQDVVSNYSKTHVINYKKTAADTAITTITCQAPGAPRTAPPAQRTSGVLMIVTATYNYQSFLLPKFLAGIERIQSRCCDRDADGVTDPVLERVTSMTPRREGRRQPRGQALVTMAVSMVAIMGFIGLAIDVGMLMLARNELQNAADAAALAGAGAMYKNDLPPYNNEPQPEWTRARTRPPPRCGTTRRCGGRSPAAPSTTGYWNISGTPAGMQSTSKSPLVLSDAAAVRVQIKKAPGTNGGPISLFLAPMVGVQSEAIQASAVAVVSYPGSVSTGVLYPTAMSGCLFRTFWDTETNLPKIDPNTGAPYEFLIGSSYHYAGCESGQWTSFKLGTQSADDMKDLIRNGNPAPLAIGDTIFVQDGTETSGYVESIKDGLIGQDILVPVAEGLEGGTWQVIVGFGAFHIDDIKGGSNKYIQGHFIAGLVVPIAGPGGPSWGALIPPTLVQ